MTLNAEHRGTMSAAEHEASVSRLRQQLADVERRLLISEAARREAVQLANERAQQILELNERLRLAEGPSST